MSQPLQGRERELLEAPNFAHVATLRRDGSVHGVVVWVDVDDTGVVLNTAQGRVWQRNVERDPRVTLTVANHENPYEFVEIRGRVVATTTDGADEHIDRMAMKYLSRPSYPFRTEGEVRVMVRVEADHVRRQG